MSYTWRCTVCDTASGTTDTEAEAAAAFLDHYVAEHHKGRTS